MSSDDIEIAVGRLTKTHGVRGEIKLTPFFPEAVESVVGKEVIIKNGVTGASKPFLLKSLRQGPNKTLLATFEGIQTPEAAREITPGLIIASQSKIPPLPEGEYYYEEIIGLPAYDEQDRFVGRLKEFFPAGEKDVWVFVDDDGNETMTPCLPETILKVDLENGKITVRLMETTE